MADDSDLGIVPVAQDDSDLGITPVAPVTVAAAPGSDDSDLGITPIAAHPDADLGIQPAAAPSTGLWDKAKGLGLKALDVITPARSDVEGRLASNVASLRSTATPDLDAKISRIIADNKIPTSKVDAATMALNSIFTLGFDAKRDAIENAVGLAATSGKFSDVMDYYRMFRDLATQRQEQAQTEHGTTYALSSLAGGLGTIPLMPSTALGKSAFILGTSAIWGTNEATADLTQGQVSDFAKQLGTSMILPALFEGAGGTLKGASALRAASRSEEATERLATIMNNKGAFDKAESVLKQHSEAEQSAFKLIVEDADKSPDTFMEAVTPDIHPALVEKGRAAVGPDVMSAFESDAFNEVQSIRAARPDSADAAAAARKAVEDLKTITPGLNEALVLSKAASKAGLELDDYLAYRWVSKQGKTFRSVAGVGDDLSGMMQRDPALARSMWGSMRVAQETIAASTTAEDVVRPGRIIQRVLMGTLDGREVAEEADRLHNVPMTVLYDNASKATIAMNVDKEMLAGWTQKFINEVKPLNANMNEIFALSKLSTPAFEAAEKAGTVSESARQYISRLQQLTGDMAEKFNIQEQTASHFYIPKQLVDTDTALVEIGRRVRDAEKAIGTPLQSIANSVDLAGAISKSPAMQDLHQAVSFFAGHVVTDKDEWMNTLKGMGNARELGVTLASKAGVMMQRTGGELPVWLQERDIPKLMAKWTNQVAKQAHMAAPIADIASMIPVMRSRGDEFMAHYLTKTVQDLVGVPRDTVAHGMETAAASFKRSMVLAADGATNPLMRSAYSSAAQLPEVLRFMQRQPYAYLLGMNPHSAMKAMSAPSLLTAQHIGEGGYGQFLHTRAMVQLLGDLGSGSKPFAEMIDKGWSAPSHNPVLYDIMKTGVPKGIVGQAADKMQDAMMFSYTAATQVHRRLVVNMAQNWANDLQRALGKAEVGASMSGSESKALSAFTKQVDSGYKRQILEAFKNQDTAGLHNSLTSYLIGKTAFNYDKVSASEFAREMGPFFAMFTKWPSAVTGDLYNIVTGESSAMGKTARVFSKYMAPLVALASVEHLVPSDQTSNSSRLPMGPQGLRAPGTVGRFILGAAPLEHWAPLDAAPFGKTAIEATTGARGAGVGRMAASAAGLDLAIPPELQMIMKAAGAVVVGPDWQDRAVGFTQAAAPLVPGAGWFRLAADLAEVYTGQPAVNLAKTALGK